MNWVWFYLSFILIWLVGSFMIFSYRSKSAGYQGRTFSMDAFESPAEFAMFCSIVFWPIYLVVLLPLFIGKFLGQRLWIRVHKAELIQAELSKQGVQ